MNWEERLPSIVAPVLSAPEIDKRYGDLELQYEQSRPLLYAEEMLATAACEVDLSRRIQHLGLCAVAYATAHQDGRLLLVYAHGVKEGKEESTYITVPENDPSFVGRYDAKEMTTIRQVILGRGVQKSESLNRIKELQTIQDSSLSGIMKSIAYAEYEQTWVSLAIKDFADTQRERLRGLQSDPYTFFDSIYQGTTTQGGFARYAGFYETFTADMNVLYARRYGDHATEVKDLLGATLFMRPQMGPRNQWSPTNLREHKLAVLQLIDSDNISGAKSYLQDLSRKNERLFNPIALQTLWGEAGPLPFEASVTLPTEDMYQSTVFDTATARQYCREVLSITHKEEIARRTHQLANHVIGVVTPPNPAVPIFDIRHFDRHQPRAGRGTTPVLTGPSYTIVDLGTVRYLERQKVSPEMNDVIILAMMATRRFVTLGQNVHPGDLTRDMEEEFIQRLYHERAVQAHE